jgi:hypothetical protein
MSGKQVPDLGGLIQAKGAPRPSDIPQRGGGTSATTSNDPRAPTQTGEQAAAAPAPTPAPAESLVPVQPSAAKRAAAAAEPRTKSLTLRLSESQYQRLRRFAFDSGSSHQDVIEAALMEHLDKEGA